MNQFLMNTLVIMSFILSPLTLLAEAPAPMNFKNFKIVKVDDHNLEITLENEKIKIESLGENRFKLNGAAVAWTPSDTLEMAYNKTQRAYQSSKKKSALLDQLFIKDAHAAPPFLFSLIFGGIIGAGLAGASCNRQPAAPSYGAPAAQ